MTPRMRVSKLGVGIKYELNIMTKKRSSQKEWDELIKLAESKAAISREKTGQLEALIATFRRQAKAGDPCPTTLAGLGSDLSHAYRRGWNVGRALKKRAARPREEPPT